MRPHGLELQPEELWPDQPPLTLITRDKRVNYVNSAKKELALFYAYPYSGHDREVYVKTYRPGQELSIGYQHMIMEFRYHDSRIYGSDEEYRRQALWEVQDTVMNARQMAAALVEELDR